MSRCILFFLYLAFGFIVDAQQLNFIKTLTSDSTEFTYTFKSSKSNTSSDLKFSIPTSHIKSSYTLIPNLNVLRVELQPYFNEAARSIAKPYMEQINASHRNSIQEFTQRNKSKLETYNLNFTCTNDDPVRFNFVYKGSGSYQYNFKTYACTVLADTEIRWDSELGRIKDIVDLANAKLKYGSKIMLSIKKNNYDLKSSIKAPNQSELELMKDIINNAFSEIKDIQNNFNYTQRELQSKIDEVNKELSLIFDEMQKEINEARNTISYEFEQILKNKFSEYYFLIEHINSQPTILLDFFSIVEQSLEDMKEISNSLFDSRLDTRAQITKILLYFQTIPYNTLQGREIEGYKGYLPPLALIDKNKGDCDSKSAALISILKNIYPERNTLIVLIKNHAFVAIDIPVRSQDTTVVYNNTQYVVLEPVGPATVGIGKASSQSMRAIRSAAYEKIFAF